MHNLDYVQLTHPEVGFRANGVGIDQAVPVVTDTASHQLCKLLYTIARHETQKNILAIKLFCVMPEWVHNL